MALATVRPTEFDLELADQISSHARPMPEEVASALTWGADEHVLVVAAAALWVYAKVRKPSLSRTANHIALVTVATAIAPHILKNVFDQTRPDRRTVRGHWRGIPFSGNPKDAFPSGHAVHMGALASAASSLPPKQRAIVWGTTIGFCFTRVALLAHWASDVAAGFAVGVAIERGIRCLTGYPRRRGTNQCH